MSLKGQTDRQRLRLLELLTEPKIILCIYPVCLGPVLDDRDAGLSEGLVLRGQSSHISLTRLAGVTAIGGSYKVISR